MDRESLILENLRLVHSCCQRFKGKGFEYVDLYQAGCVGLCKAADKFDIKRGFAFSTYAFPVILGEIKKLFRDGGYIKVSRELKSLSLKASNIYEELSQTLGREPRISEVADKLNISIAEAAEVLNISSTPVSLSYSNESGELKELDISTDEEDYIYNKVAVEQILDTLNDFEEKLIRLRYLDNKTQSDTAKVLGITQVAVSRSEKRILKHLRETVV